MEYFRWVGRRERWLSKGLRGGREKVSLCSSFYSAGQDVAFGSILELSLKTYREKYNSLKSSPETYVGL